MSQRVTEKFGRKGHAAPILSKWDKVKEMMIKKQKKYTGWNTCQNSKTNNIKSKDTNKYTISD
jgi:hypothetical protein